MEVIKASLKIHLLGPFRVFVNDTMVGEKQWTRRKPRLLVKLLALHHGQQLHQEQVTEALWPDEDPETGIRNMYRTVHSARRALEPELKSGARSRFILTRDRKVILSSPGELWIDAGDFEQRAARALASQEPELYEAALSLYEGDLLIEDRYEDWAAIRREELSLLRRKLLGRLAIIFEQKGDYPRGIERLKELVAIDPADEEAHRRLMHLYALTGNRHQALLQYRQCLEIMRRELDQEPEEATAALYRQIASVTAQPPAEHLSDRYRAVDSLAVLPLVNADSDRQLEYLCSGIPEGVISRLSSLRKLRVLAWGTVSRYSGQAGDPLMIGRTLGVRAVASGRVHKSGDHLMLSAELVNVADGTQLWGEQYRVEVSGIPDLQEEIAKQISGRLHRADDQFGKSVLRRTCAEDKRSAQ